MINSHLKIPVNRQINIISCGGLNLRNNLHNTSHVIDNQLRMALSALKLQLHGRLNAGPSYHIVNIVIRIFLLQLLKLLLLHLSGISDNRRKVNAVIVFADGGLFNSHTLELIHMLHNIGNRFLVYLPCNHTGFIFFIGNQRHGIPDIYNLESFIIC